MFNHELHASWTRTSSFDVRDPLRSVADTSFTRRQILGLPAIGVAGGLIAGCEGAAGRGFAIAETNLGLRVTADDVTWAIERSVFGLLSNSGFRWSEARKEVVVPLARWVGTGIRYDIRFVFVRRRGKWCIRVISDALSVATRVISLDQFVLDGVPAGHLSVAGKLLERLGWLDVASAARMHLQPDGAWRISTPRTARAADGLTRSRNFLVTVHSPGTSPLDLLRKSRKNWSTSVQAQGLSLARSAELHCGTSQTGRSIALRPERIDRHIAVRCDSGEHAIGATGSWVVRFGNGKPRLGGLNIMNGLVLVGQARGRRHVSASLPISDVEHSVELPGGTMRIRGFADRHRMELRSTAGRVDHCRACASVVHVPVKVAGADYSQVEFERQEFVADLTRRGRPNDLVTAIFATGLFGQWWIPMEKAVLRVATAKDLLSLKFEFQNVVLVRRLGGWRLEIDDPARQPLMIVEFPPQHVMEQSFLRQLNLPTNSGQVPGEASDDNGEPFVRVVEARLSGASRLAFFVERDGWRRRLRVPLTLKGLTQWEHLELSVAPAAHREMAGDKPITDVSTILRNKKIVERGVAGRMDSVLALGIAGRPARDVTSIEIPARLSLSPDQNAIFDTRSVDFSRSVFKNASGLWGARLAEDRASDPHLTKLARSKAFAENTVRAIGSPDFRHSFFIKSTVYDNNIQTPWGRNLRFPLSMRDRHELVALTALYGLPIMPRLQVFEGAPPDRQPDPNGKEPSPPPVTGLPDVKPGDSAIAPENRRRRNSPEPNWHLPELEKQATYIPPAIPAQELRLTSLGGSVSLDGRFEPPAPPDWAEGHRPTTGDPLFPALTVEAWRQVSVVGRDRLAEVVYKGFLLPIGLRASLVKRTERYFASPPGSKESVAYLVQRFFIRITRPDKTYPALGHPFESRDFPVADLRFLTKQTPDLRDPQKTGQEDSNHIAPGGRVSLTGTRGLIFWPRTRHGLGSEVRFEISLDGRPGTLKMPLLFLDNEAAHDPDTVEALVKYYIDRHPDTGLTTARHEGAARRYAPEIEPGSATFETQRWICGARGRGDRPGDRFRMDAAMEGADQPPFYPFIREAHLLLRPLQGFSSKPSTQAITSYDDLYVRQGFVPEANPAQLYLAVHGYLPEKNWYASARVEPVRLSLDGTGDRSGGVAHPNVITVNLSQVSGPVGGQSAPPRPLLAPAAAVSAARPPGLPALVAEPLHQSGAAAASGAARGGAFSPADFFPGDARLLGILSLKDIVKAALYDQAPKLLEQAEAAEAEIGEQLDRVSAELNRGLAAAGRALTGLVRMLETETPFDRTVGQLYGGLAAAVTNAQGSVVALQALIDEDAGSPIQRLQNLVRGGKALNRSIQAILIELDRIGRDPVPQELTRLTTLITGSSEALLSEAGTLLLGQLGSVAREAISKLLTQPLQGWVASALGPDAYARIGAALALLESGKAAEQVIDDLLKQLAATATEAIAYEAIGKPALEAIATTLNAVKEIERAKPTDVDQLIRRVGESCERVVAANLAAIAHTLQVAGCSNFYSKLAPLFSSGPLIGGIQSAKDSVVACEAALDKLSQIQARLEQCLAEASALRSNATPGDAAAGTAYAKVLAARDQVARIRTQLATVLDRMDDGLTALQNEAVVFTADPRDACGQINRYVGSATRWMNHRLRIVRDVQVLFRLAADAFDAEIVKADSTAIAARLADCALQADTELNQAALQVGSILQQATQLAALLSSLRSGQDQILSDTIRAAALALGGQAPAEIERAITDFVVEHRSLLLAMTAVSDGIRAAGDAAALRPALAAATETMDRVDRFVREQERRLVGAVVAPLASVRAEAQHALLAAARPLLRAAVDALATAHLYGKSLLAPFESLDQTETEIFRYVLRQELADFLLPPRNPDVGGSIETQRIELETLGRTLASSGPLGDGTVKTLIAWRDRLAAIRGQSPEQPPALYLLVQAVAEVANSLLHGRIQDLVDVRAIRRQIERSLLNLVLPRVRLTYGLGTELNDLPPFFSMNRENPGQYGGDTGAEDLSLHFEMSLDLQNPAARTMVSRGVLQPFNVNIFEVVTLYFRKAEFVSENGGSPKVDIKVADVELGAAVEFVQKLQESLGMGDSGFYIDLRFAPPAIEAGFMIDLGTISIGSVSFINVSLGASVEIPFTNNPALFRFNLARRAAPFLISAAPFGGGGFLSLIANAKGLVGFEASFEYGGVAAFGFGPLRGSGRVTTGIYIARGGASAAMAGFFVAAGSAQIACFGVSTSLLISIEQKGGGNMVGSATYSFSFSLGIKKITYSVQVARTVAKGWGGQGGRRGLSEASARPQRRRAGLLPFATADQADEPVAQAAGPAPKSQAVGIGADWKRYQSYFDGSL